MRRQRHAAFGLAAVVSLLAISASCAVGAPQDGQPTLERLAPEQVKTEASRVLADPRYADPTMARPWVTQLVEKILDWINGLRGSVVGGIVSRLFGLVGQGIYWIVVVVGTGLVVTVLWLILSAIARRRTRSLAPEPPPEADGPSDEVLVARMTLRQLLRRAEQARAEGDYRAAIRYLFHALLRALHNAGAIQYELRRPNREYLAALAERAEAYGLFQQALSTFEAKWYGLQQASLEEAVAFERLCRPVWEAEAG